PKLDVPAPSSSQSKAPLQGHLRHNTKSTDLLKGATDGMGGVLGGSRKGQSDNSRIKGKASNNGFNVQAQSGIGIIGVKFVMMLGRPPVINRVFPLTPAADQGLKINDVIVAVDGVPTFGLAKEEVYDMIVGTPGTPVTLSLSRNGDFRVLTLTRMDLNDI